MNIMSHLEILVHFYGNKIDTDYDSSKITTFSTFILSFNTILPPFSFRLSFLTLSKKQPTLN